MKINLCWRVLGVAAMAAGLVACASMVLDTRAQSPSSEPTFDPVAALMPEKGTLCESTDRQAAHPYFAWSEAASSASQRAMQQCQHSSAQPSACAIVHCWSTEAPVVLANNQWLTCYVAQPHRTGVWSATAHSRLTAVSLALSRCAAQTKLPTACTLRYCRVW